MNYTEAEVDAVALAIVNDDQRMAGRVGFARMDEAYEPSIYRSNARAALAARDALFEVVGERWEVRIDGEVDHCGTDPDPMHGHARMVRSRDGLTADEVTVVHVTTKRRKR
jgi:hypothetical protein